MDYDGQSHTDDGYSIKEVYYYEGNDPTAAKIDAKSLISEDDIVYSGSTIEETNVNRDADDSLITRTLP